MANLLVPLRVRLALLVALVVTLVVTSATYLELRTFETSIGNDLIESAKSTAQSVADDLELRTDPVNERDEVADTLREFLEAVPSIRVLSVVTFDGDQAQVLASTSSAERAEAIAVARRAMARNEPEFAGDNGLLRMVGVPVRHDDRVIGGVVATYSMASVEELRRRGRTVVLWFVPAAVLLLTLLVDLPTRRLIHQPIGRDPPDDAAGARAASWARGRRCCATTRSARWPPASTRCSPRWRTSTSRSRTACARRRASCASKNDELRGSYERVFALREALARADQMAAVGHMAASVAHQIGTPLNLISGYVQVIREEEGADVARDAAARDRAGADREGHVDRAHDARSRAAADAEGADRHRRAAFSACATSRGRSSRPPACASSSSVAPVPPVMADARAARAGAAEPRDQQPRRDAARRA